MNKEKLNTDALKELQEQLNKMNPIDLAEDFDELSHMETAIRIKLLDKDLLADTFTELSKAKKYELIQILSENDTKELFQELDEDEVVDTLQELPANMVGKIMRYVDEERKPIITKLLGYPEESVGSIMSVNFLSAKQNRSVDFILQKVKESDLDADKLEQIWMTDETLKLVGFIYLADLIRANGTPVKELINDVHASVTATDDQEVVAKLATRYDLSEIPVVDSENRLIGTVPAEWAIDVVVDEYYEDLDNIHGITESDEEESYFDAPDRTIVKNRVMWLIICLVTATFTGLIIQHYEQTLAASVALAAYIPMLMDSGGNAGSQSSTTIIRSLYQGEVTQKDFLRVVFKEMRVGFFVGLILVLVNMVRIQFLDTVPMAVNITVSITLLLTVMMSKIIGGILPIIADTFNVDPTVMAGPLITTIVDTFALLIYFEVATQIIF